MEQKTFALCRKQFLVAAAGLAILAGPAFAQDYYRSAADEEVIVQAPYMQREDIGPEPGSLLARQRVSYSVPVNFADLDLNNPGDEARLERRIYHAAGEACHQLDRHFPPSIYIPGTSETRRDCVERAADVGMAKVRMIARAESEPPHD
jgi:UrcA family protein